MTIHNDPSSRRVELAFRAEDLRERKLAEDNKKKDPR